MKSSSAYKKKLLFVISSLGFGGAERALVRLVNYLDKSKYEILLVLFFNAEIYQKDLDPTVKVICLDKKSKWDFIRVNVKLRNIIKEYRPNVVISFLYFVNVTVMLASLFSHRTYRLLLNERGHPHRYLYEDKYGLLRKWLIKLTYPRADMILTNSKSTEEVIKRDFSIQPDKIRTIYNPFPLREIGDKAKEEIEFMNMENGSCRVIISVGRLVKVKRFDVLLHAFSLVKKKYDKVHLIVLGEGELRQELEDLALKLNIRESVDFVGFKSNPYAWISKADIFVLSSDSEGFPNVIVESMACGVPVISTASPSGSVEIITNGENGILVPLADEEKLAEAIFFLLDNEKIREKIRAEGIRRAEDFRIEKIVEEYVSCF